MSRSQAIVLLVAIAALAACRGTPTELSAPGVLRPGDNDTLELLTEAQAPIHVGDGRRLLGGVPREWMSSNPPAAYTWVFALARRPDRAYASVKLHNIGRLMGGCATDIRVNERSALLLFEQAVAQPGYREPITRSFPVAGEFFQVGRNTLSVRQTQCRDGQRNRVRNDILLRALQLELRYEISGERSRGARHAG